MVGKHGERPFWNESILIKSNVSLPSTSSTSLIIPRTIFNESSFTNSSRNHTVIFILYKETSFFTTNTNTSSHLNSFVIAGSIKGVSVTNLRIPVQIALQSIFPGNISSTLCSYWDFSLQDWSQEGCWFEGVFKDGRVLCKCNHLTNFAMLMVSRQNVPCEKNRINCLMKFYKRVFGISSKTPLFDRKYAKEIFFFQIKKAFMKVITK